MRRKTKMTPFARLFIALLIIVPLSFVIASLVNGENSFEKLKETIGLGDSAPTKDASTADISKAFEKEVANLEEKIEKLKEENNDLLEQLNNKENEIKYLKKQMNTE